ncbi:DUF1980 domain-containing protein [Rubritalea tangerina]|uniref:DUF1980 domain-containing protein n=2 Tax=Rubritalea tangerina TaxID=430798 RepID=A0ABW4Z965_9BACT
MIRIQRIAFSLSMLIWGGVMLYFYQGPHIDAYLSPKFQTPLLIGGAATVVVGLFNLFTFKVESSCHHGGDCSHDHEGSDLNPFMALLIILLPLLVALNWTEHKVADEHIAKQSAQDLDPASMRFLADLPPFTKETLDETRQKSADGFYQMNLLELFYSAGDSELERVFTGLNFETTGMIRTEPNRNPDGKRMRLYRLFMTCCAADMKTIPLSIEFDGELPQFDDNTWVLVGGEMYYETIEGVTYPVMKIKRIEKTESPESELDYK